MTMTKIFLPLLVICWVGICLSQPTKQKDIEVCEREFFKCFKDSKTPEVCRSTFITCVDSSKQNEDDTIPVSKEVFMLNFKCCFKDLTSCLTVAGTNKTSVRICKLQMFGCTLRHGKYLQQPSPKSAWLGDAPRAIQVAVTNHVKCYTKQNEHCCTLEYHKEVEVMLVRDCFHKLLHCRREGSTDEFCKNAWNKCFEPDCTRCTECNKAYYSKVPLLFRTHDLQNVQACDGKSDIDQFIQCVLDLRLADLPSPNDRKKECFEVLRKSKSDVKKAIASYQTCVGSNSRASSPKVECLKIKHTVRSGR